MYNVGVRIGFFPIIVRPPASARKTAERRFFKNMRTHFLAAVLLAAALSLPAGAKKPAEGDFVAVRITEVMDLFNEMDDFLLDLIYG